MKPSLIKEALKAAISAGQPVFLEGPSGGGKSQVVHQVLDELEYEKIDVRAAQLDPVDLRGLPRVDDGVTSWAPPVFLPRHSGPGGIFLDELTSAPTMVQGALYQLILDRALGEYTLPEGWALIGAGNRSSDRGVTNRMPAPLANRFLILEYEVDLDDWTDWATKNDVRSEVIAFCRFRRDLLHDFKPDMKSFPSPRSWAFVSRMLDTGKVSSSIEFGVFAGLVGDGAAAEFCSFMRTFRSLVTIEEIKADPKHCRVPDNEPSLMYALSTLLGKELSRANMATLIQYIERMPKEFQVLTVRDAVSRDGSLASTKEFIKWAQQAKHVFA